MTEDVKNIDANAPKKLSIQRRTKTTVSGTTAGGKAKAYKLKFVKNGRYQLMLHRKQQKLQN